MGLRSFLEKQFVDVVQWTEPDSGILAYRYPMADLEIQNGAQLTVRESQMAAFVNEGRIADVFGPGLYTLNTRTLPLLTDLMNWTKEFHSPFKSDVFFFSTRIQIDQRWGTATPITIREKEFGAVRIRVYGIYSYRITDPRTFFRNVSGTQETYHVEDLEGQLRNTIVARMTEVLAPADLPFLDMAANQAELGRKVSEGLRPSFAGLGIELDSFLIESLSLPEELQKMLDERIGMNLAGDMTRYTQFEAARSLPLAAANRGNGAAATGAILGIGAALGQNLFRAVQNDGAMPDSKFCPECGHGIPRPAKFCPECGKPQA